MYDVSIEYAELLFRRARMYLESAVVNFSSGRFDVAAVEAEIAAQLALKALIAKLGFEPPRAHAIRQLLSFVIDNRLLQNEILEDIKNFIKHNREKLIVLERARAAGQYSGLQVDRDEAEISVSCAKEVLSVVEKCWKLIA